MPFGKMTKQDLIDAGLDPDKFASLIGTAVTKDDLAALKTELSTTVTDLIKNQFTELENKLKPNNQNNNNNNDNNNNNNNNNREDEPNEFESFTTDPVAHINKKVGGVALATAVEIKKTTRNIAFSNALSTFPYMKNAAIKAEVEEEWKKYTPELMARNNADPEKLIEQIYKMVIGNHHDEIIQDRDKKDGKYNLVHAGSSSGGGSNSNDNGRSNNDNKPTLTDREKEAAQRFGLTEDEYIQQRKDSVEEEKTRRLAKVGA